MESEIITLSQTADTIIVVCFCTAAFLTFLYVIGEAICTIFEFIRTRWKVRKERKTRILDDSNEQSASE